MSPARLAELNDRLANPPEFNPSDSEQLGLFVVGQLAKRHGIRVTLKASPYGGTAAIVLIPRNLVVAEEAFRAGLPGEPAPVAMAQLTANGNHAGPAELAAQGGGFTEAGDGLPGLAQTPGVRISGPLRRSQGIIPERFYRGAHAAPALGPASGAAGTGPDDLPGRRHAQPGGSGSGRTAGPGPSAPYPGDGSYSASPSYPVSGSSPYPAAGSGPVPGVGAPPFPGTGSAPFPGSGSPSYPDQPAPFPGWNLHNTPGAAGSRTGPGSGPPAGPAGPATPMTPMTPVASPRPGQASGPPWELPRESGPPPGPDGSAPSPGTAEPDENGDIRGLPRRVRQASLAPQLRADPPQRRTTMASVGAAAGPTGPTGPSPAEIRQTMSALQRGWQEGRSQRMDDPLSDESAAGSSSGTIRSTSASGPDPSFGGRADDSATNEEARGSSDGS